MPAWQVSFEVLVPDGEAADDGEAIAYAREQVRHAAEDASIVEPIG
jgi:hypothetical protein